MQICPGLHTAYKTFWARLACYLLGFLLRRTLVRLAPRFSNNGKCQAISATKTGSRNSSLQQCSAVQIIATQEAMPCNT